MTVRSFAPIAAASARVLIVGSMPGERSLQAGQYYAHPQNAFWSILGAICGFDPAATYAARSRRLRAAGIALWDVFRSCERSGSLDAAIVADSIEVNDFVTFLARHRRIDVVLCNGATAHAAFERSVRPLLLAADRSCRSVRLPSTSPAHASISRAEKLAIWRRQLLAVMPADSSPRQSAS